MSKKRMYLYNTKDGKPVGQLYDECVPNVDAIMEINGDEYRVKDVIHVTRYTDNVDGYTKHINIYLDKIPLY